MGSMQPLWWKSRWNRVCDHENPNYNVNNGTAITAACATGACPLGQGFTYEGNIRNPYAVHGPWERSVLVIQQASAVVVVSRTISMYEECTASSDTVCATCATCTVGRTDQVVALLRRILLYSMSSGLHFSSDGHQTSCEACGAGTYQDESSQSSCKNCEAEHTKLTGSPRKLRCWNISRVAGPSCKNCKLELNL